VNSKAGPPFDGQIAVYSGDLRSLVTCLEVLDPVASTLLENWRERFLVTTLCGATGAAAAAQQPP